MVRTLLCALVLGACIIGLGADLARTAYGAARTAATITLASLDRARSANPW
jgi:hypothetical protein